MGTPVENTHFPNILFVILCTSLALVFNADTNIVLQS